MQTIENNLSRGNIQKRLILFALPFLISNIVQSLYNVADMLIVGNFSGTAAMSGVNIGGQVTFILTQIVVGFCVGGSVLIAQYVGAQNKKELYKTTSTLITSLLYVGVAFTVVMLLLKDPILRLIQTPQESFSQASDYLFVTVLGILFIFAYNALSAILRGMGDSKRPLYFVLIACITNIGLDLLLVAQFSMGALGAAIATVFSQALSVFLCMLHLKRNNFLFDFKRESFRIEKETLLKIIKIGLPTSVQNGVTSISFLIITAMVNITGGVNASAAVGAISKFNGFAIMPAVAMGSSVSTVAAQNIGAQQWHRAKQACGVGIWIAVIFSVAIFVLVQLYPSEILALFDRNPDMIASGIAYIRIFSLDYLIVPFLFCLNGLFMGAGHTTFSLINNALSSILLRVPAALILGMGFHLGLTGIAMGAPVASLGALGIVLWFYYSKKWQINKVAQLNETMADGS